MNTCSKGDENIIKNIAGILSGFNLNIKLFLTRTFILGIYSGIHGVIFNLYILELGYREDFLGLMLSITLLASSLSSIPAGIICDRIGRKRMLVVSSLLSALAMLPLLLFVRPEVLLFFSALTGIFGAFTSVAVSPFLIENTKKEDSVNVFSANSSLSWTATIIGCALGGLMPGIWKHVPALATMNSYRLTLLVSITLMMFGWGVLLLIKEDGRGKCNLPPLSIKNMKPSHTAMKFTLITMIVGIGSGMIVPFFNVYFTKVLSADVLETGLVFSIADVFMVIGFMIIPYMSTRIGRIRSAVLTQLISIPFLIMMALTTNFMLAAAAYIARMFLMNMAGPAMSSFQMETFKKSERSFAIGVISTGNSLAVAASTFTAGILMAHGHYLIQYAVTCSAYLIAAVLLYHYFGRHDKPLIVIKDDNYAGRAATKDHSGEKSPGG